MPMYISASEAVKDAYMPVYTISRSSHTLRSHRARAKKLAGIKTIEGKHWLPFVEA